MLTERTYDSAVFNVLVNIKIIYIFIEQLLIEILYEILISVMRYGIIDIAPAQPYF